MFTRSSGASTHSTSSTKSSLHCFRKRSWLLFRLMSVASGFNTRRSENYAQQEHEREILKQHYPEIDSDDPHSFDIGSDDGKYGDNDITKGMDDVSLKDKVKGFWNDVVKPDIDMIKQSIQLETSVKRDLNDVRRYPEVAYVAEIRRGADLCIEEKEYLTDRKWHVRDAFARYLGLNPGEVHPDDVPIIGLGGSGGGFRAMLGCLGYGDEMKKSGLWDVLTYVAGVSGTCWSLAAYYTFGETSMTKVIEHCKKRLHPHHPLSPEAIRTVLNAPNGPYTTLGPLVQKHHSGLHTVAMDLYSVFTTGYLFLVNDPSMNPNGGGPRRELAGYHQDWFKWTNAMKYLAGGAEPYPILTAIRHERPWKDWVDPKQPFKEANATSAEHAEARDGWFQWFEMTPFEIGCDELEAWVPTWGFGRPFSEGKSTMQLPEQSLALLLGLCTSAPAGPLTSYLATIKRNLPSGFIGNAISSLSTKIANSWGKQGREEFQQHHPLHACNEHNFLYHLTPVAPGQTRPPGIENSPRIHLIDSGMDNNCPTYVLLNPSRKVDVILNMDASSDVQKDTFQDRVDQIGSRRGLKFAKRDPGLKANPDVKDPDRFKGMYSQIYDGTMFDRPATVIDSYGHIVTNPPAAVCTNDCSMVYMPLLPNNKAVPDFDPSTAKFSGSYNLVWTPDQVEMLIKVCTQNFRDGEPTIKQVLMESYEKKKARNGR